MSFKDYIESVNLQGLPVERGTDSDEATIGGSIKEMLFEDSEAIKPMTVEQKIESICKDLSNIHSWCNENFNNLHDIITDLSKRVTKLEKKRVDEVTKLELLIEQLSEDYTFNHESMVMDFSERLRKLEEQNEQSS